jgi:phosphoserine phosphatase RsbU/P
MDRAWNLSREELSPLAASWLARGATTFGVWQAQRPLLCWPPGHAPGSPDLSAPLERTDPASIVLGVSGVNSAAAAAQLAVDAQLVGQLAFKEHESEALTAELASCQDLLLAIYGLARSFRSTIDLDVTLSVIAREATRLLRGVMGFVVIEGDALPLVAVTEPPGAVVDLDVARETLRGAAPDGRALVVSDARALGVRHASQALVAPIPIAGPVTGAIVVVGRAGAFQAPDVKLAHAIAEQASVPIENALLHRRRVEQVRLENEMQVAARVQADLLPHSWPDVDGLDLAATTRPASHVCGDFYDVVPVAGGQLVATLGDVSGKGVPAALVMTMTRTFLRSAIRAAAPGDLERILSLATVSAYEELGGLDMFSTAVVVCFDPASMRVRYINAGHAPVVYKPRDGRAQLLVADGPPLGMLAHAVGEAHDRALGNGDLFVVATDGLNEASNPDGELFGYERLLGIIDAEAQQDAATITQHLLASVEAFQNGRPRDDDQTVLVMKGRAR